MSNSVRMPVRVWFLSSAQEAWGAEQSLKTLVRHFDGCYVEPTLFASAPELIEAWRSYGHKAHLVSAGRSRNRYLQTVRWLISFLLRCRGRPDVVVLFSLPLASTIDIIRARLGYPKSVLDLHDYLQTDRGRKRVRAVTKRFSRVITISRFAASQVASEVPITVLTRPVEGPSASPRPKPHPCTIGIIGRIDPDKNIEFALAVANAMPHHRFELRGTSTREWDGYASELRRSATPNVHWIGRVPTSEVLGGLTAVFVPNHNEALGRVVLEAQLASVPVVVPSRGGPAELVEAGSTGYLYTPSDVATAVAAIHQACMSNDALLQNARVHAAEVSNPIRYAEAYLRALKD